METRSMSAKAAEEAAAAEAIEKALAPAREEGKRIVEKYLKEQKDYWNSPKGQAELEERKATVAKIQEESLKKIEEMRKWLEEQKKKGGSRKNKKRSNKTKRRPARK